MPVLLLFFGLAAAAFTWNVYRPMGGGSRRGVLSFLAGWLTGELALHHIAWQVLVVGLLVAVGALRSWSRCMAEAGSSAARTSRASR